MSLYLKYRPADFKNLEGQSFVKETLQKAIAENKTVGAYLLCGPRGTGKTTTARILAKTINCENNINGNPCLECSICKEFAEDRLIDIIEIDAASVTGVDNIRDIIEKSQFKPTKTKYKVYIIDEVHMLSKGAFNALLKILEEPPEHVKFILATTETHKVPETIISRCQRYDFKRISDEDIRHRLSYIAESEKIKTDEKAINYIIKNSSGGLRNAISLFEQLIFDNEINYEQIVEKLEIVDESDIESFLNKLLQKDSSVIEILDKNISDGKNIKLFFKELLFYTKNKSLEILKKKEDISGYINILDILDDTFTKTKNSLDENITFTIGILKILHGNLFQNQSNNNKQQVPNIPSQQVNQTQNIYASNNTNKIQNNTENNEITQDDLQDVFGDASDTTIQQEVPKIITKKDPFESNNVGFDINTFISKLKTNGAKGGLTMCMRGVSMSMNGETLMIKPSNKIQKGQIDNVDNSSLIIKSLIDMGFANPNIKIN